MEGKVAIITAGNSGVGAVTAQKFAAEGAKVVSNISKPEDVVNILLFFASDESRAITGQTLVTDLGSTL